MKTRTKSVLEALNDIQQFLDDNAKHVGLGLEVVRRRLDNTAAGICSLSAAQEEAIRAGLAATQEMRTLREELRDEHMRPIAEIAKQRLAGRSDPRLLTLRGANAGQSRLALSARVMADAAIPHVETLTECGLQEDFVERLLAAADALSRAAQARRTANDRRSGATAALMQREREGRGIIQLLDALVRPRLRGYTVLLARWCEAICVSRTAEPKPVSEVPAATLPGNGNSRASTRSAHVGRRLKRRR
jgi:hypothetical protein